MSLPPGPNNAGNSRPGYQRPAWIAGAIALLVLIAVAAFLIGRNSGTSDDSPKSSGDAATAQGSNKNQSTTDRSTTSRRSSTTFSTRRTTTTIHRGSTNSSRQSTTSIRQPTTARTQRDVDHDSGLRIVGLSRLPGEAADTYALIESDGPFPFDRDGVVFQNRERQLPSHPSGWYHEYTVITPGSDDRGARRLIVGKDDTVYYTQDHYDSFVVVDVDR